MKYIIIALAFLTACGGVDPRVALSNNNQIEIVIINVLGQDSIQWEPLHEVVMPQVLQRYQNDTGFDVVFKAYVELTDFYAGWLYQFEPYVFTQRQRLNWCAAYVKDNFELKPWRLHFCIFPPMFGPDGKKLFGGIAYKPGNVAIGQCSATSSHTPPRDRLPGCYIVIAHETGHNNDMSHLDAEQVCDGDRCWGGWGAQLLDPGAGRFTDSHGYALPFHSTSAMEMRDYWRAGERGITKRLRKCKTRRCKKRKRNRLRNWPRRSDVMEVFA